jgi:hypothetical protein
MMFFMEISKKFLVVLSLLFVLAHEARGGGYFSKQISENVGSSAGSPIPYGRVVDLGNDVYTGAGLARSGKTIYFGMQKITAENEADIDHFKRVTLMMSDRNGRGAIGAVRLTDILKGKTLEEAEYKELNYGATPEEFSDFIAHIQKNMPQKHADVLRAAAIDHMTTDVGDYIAYVSEKPITGPRSFLKTYNFAKTVKAYFEDTKDLVMTVGCSFHEKEIHVRGIQITLFSFYFDTDRLYKGVSLPLLAFTTATAKVINPTIEAFRANTMDKMTEIIRSGFGSGCIGETTIDTRIEIPEEDMCKFYEEIGKANSEHSGTSK